MQQALKAIELFAGAGGLGVGFLMADHPLIRYQLLMAIDNDDDSIKSYQRNMQWLAENAKEVLPEGPKIYNRNVEKLRSKAILRAYKLKRGELDILLGGPPCQGYSPSNRQTRQKRKNELNNLVKAFLDKVDDLLPKMFLIENVQGVQWTNPTDDMHIDAVQMSLFPNEKPRANDVRDYIVSTARTLGYEVWHKIIDSADYGVPQRRMRFFILGVRKDILGDKEVNLTRFLGQKRVPQHLTVNQAIGDLPALENGQVWKGDDYEPSSDPYICFLRKFMGNNELHDHFATRHQEHIIDRYKEIPEGKNWSAIKHLMNTYTDVERTHSNIYRRLIGKAPAHTISHYRKSMTIHPSQHRGLSFREACRLQSFPDWFRFQGGSDSGQQQLANAVPPLLAATVAWAIAELWCDIYGIRSEAQVSADAIQASFVEILDETRVPELVETLTDKIPRRGRPPGFFIRIERNQTEQRERIKLFVAKGLWYALSQPDRLELHRIDGQIILSPTTDLHGHEIEYAASMPRFWCDNSEHMLEAYPTGRYIAEVHDGRIFMHRVPQEQLSKQQTFE